MRKNNLAYYMQGKGETILMLHGWGGSAKSLFSLQKELAKDFQAITLDLPGFGNSKTPATVYGINDYTKAVIFLADKLKIERFSIFGHSFGGQIAVKIALNYPQRVKKLILCGAAVLRKSSFSAKTLMFFSKPFKKLGLTPYLAIFLKNTDYQKASPKMKKVMTKILNEDLSQKLPFIKQNTLILWGENDNITPLKDAYFIKSQIPDSKLEIFADQKHSLPLKEPKKVAVAIKEFLK